MISLEERKEKSSLAELLGLTNQQLKVLAFIMETIHAKGYSPTLREICENFSFSLSPNAAVCHIKPLVKKGLLKQEHRTYRHNAAARTWRPTIRIEFLKESGICPEFFANPELFRSKKKKAA